MTETIAPAESGDNSSTDASRRAIELIAEFCPACKSTETWHPCVTDDDSVMYACDECGVSMAVKPALKPSDNHTYRLNSERWGTNPCEWPDCTRAATIATDQPGIPWGQFLICDEHAREIQVDDIDATGDSAFVRQLAKNLARAVKDADDTVWAEIGRAMLGRAIEEPSSMFVSDIDVVADATGVPMGLLLFGDES